MSDSTKNVDIRVNMDPRPAQAGAAATTEAIHQVRSATGEMAHETGKATEAVKEHEEHLEGSRAIFTQLNHVVPEFGHLVHAAFEGPVGAVIALTMALVAAKEKLKEYNEELDKVSESEAEAHKKTVEDLEAAWGSAAKKLGDYWAELGNAGTDKDPIKKQVDNIKQVEAAQLESTGKLIEAMGKLEVARLRANNATPEQIAAAEARNHEAVDAINLQKSGLDVAAMRTLLAQSRAAAPGLEGAVGPALFETAAAEAKQSRAEEELKGLREQLAPGGDAGKRVEDATRALEQAKNLPASMVMSPGGAPVDMTEQNARAVEAAQKELEAAGVQRENLERRRGQLESEIALEEQRVSTAKRNEENARARAVENTARIKELPDLIDQGDKVQGVKAQEAARAAELNVRVAGTGQTVGQLLDQAHLTTDVVEKTLDALLDHSFSLMQLVQNVHARVAYLEAQSKHATGNAVPGF